MVHTVSNRMRKYILIAMLTLCSMQSVAATKVFACEPEWQSLADLIGGDYVKTYSATTAFQDPHHIEARPSLIAKARRADLLICSGAELEIGWLPLLLRRGGNKKIQVGQAGYLMASDIVENIEVPDVMDRSMGDIHAEGNPHVHLDPDKLAKMAKVIADRLCTIDGKHCAEFTQNLTVFNQRMDDMLAATKGARSLLKGKQVVVYHKNWSYLLQWLGMEQVADLEPKPGVSPSSAYLLSLLGVVKDKNPSMIMVANYQNPKPALWLEEKTNIKAMVLPFTVGGDKQSTDVISLLERLVTMMSEALPNE